MPMQETTLTVATTSRRDVKRTARALGGRVVREETTPGAVGYSDVTIRWGSAR